MMELKMKILAWRSKDEMQPKKTENHTCQYIFILKVSKRGQIQKAFDMRSVCWERSLSGDSVESPEEKMEGFVQVTSRGGKQLWTVQTYQPQKISAPSTNLSLALSFAAKSLFIITQYSEREILFSEDDLGDKLFQCLTVLIQSPTVKICICV